MANEVEQQKQEEDGPLDKLAKTFGGLNDLETSSRNLAARKLRTVVPKPNIVRIEALDGDARSRYLGGISRWADRQIRNKVYDTVKKAEDSVFYGFIKNGGTQFIRESHLKDIATYMHTLNVYLMLSGVTNQNHT